MFVWALVIIVVLLIPLFAIVLDSQIGKALADRLASGNTPEDAEKRLETLEGEVRYLSESLESLREETEFVRSLVEGSDRGPGPPRLRPGEGDEPPPPRRE